MHTNMPTGRVTVKAKAVNDAYTDAEKATVKCFFSQLWCALKHDQSTDQSHDYWIHLAPWRSEGSYVLSALRW